MNNKNTFLGRKVIGLVVLSVFSVNVSADVGKGPFELSLDELLNVEVTSVSKKSEPLSNAAASIYVISSEDIQKRGSTSIPDALKNVPGLHVAQIDSQKWAVSSRGFNGRYNTKMLVLLDGRTLYSPEYSGVYWETTDTLMEDIERIEVIRGPGAALWGVNAVNGVINIITKHTADTLGGYAEVGGGSFERAFAGFRYGEELASGVTARAYAKVFKRSGTDINDALLSADLLTQIANEGDDNSWWSQQAGGRMDISLGPETSLRLAADVYDIKMQQSTIGADSSFAVDYINETADARGWNFSSEYSRALTTRSQITVNGYFDHASRSDEAIAFSRDTFNLEFTHQYQLDEVHSLVWGAEYRYISNNLDTGRYLTRFGGGGNEKTNLYGLFAEDYITLSPDQLWLTLAARVDHHPYVGSEFQPTARLSWKVNDSHRLWTAWSRAKRIPSQLENKFDTLIGVIPPNTFLNPANVPVALIADADGEFESETVESIELGYRFSFHDRFSIDTVAFYNDYDDLRSFNEIGFELPVGPPFLPKGFVNFENEEAGHNFGIETSVNWLIHDKLKLQFNYAYIESRFAESQSQVTNAPEQSTAVTFDWQAHKNLTLTGTWRYVDPVLAFDVATLDLINVDDYHAVDLGANWQLTEKLKLSLNARNLFYGDHVEFQSEVFYNSFVVDPSYYGKITLDF